MKCELIRCIENLQYKEWCNYLEDNYFKRIYKAKELTPKLRRVTAHYEKTLHRPLIYLSGVMRVQLRFYFTRERLGKGEDIYFFSRVQTDSSDSQTSMCPNTDDILLFLKNSTLRNSTQRPIEPTKIRGLSPVLSQSNETQKRALFTGRLAPIRRTKNCETKVQNSEQSLFLLCNSLPKSPAFESEDISAIFNSEGTGSKRNQIFEGTFPNDVSIKKESFPIDACFKKKSAIKETGYRYSEYEDSPCKLAPAKTSRAEPGFRTQNSNRKSSRQKLADFKKNKTEDLENCEKTLKSRSKQTEVEPKTPAPPEKPSPCLRARKTAGFMPSHRKSLSNQILQAGRMTARSSKDLRSDYCPRTPFKEGLASHRPQVSHCPTRCSSQFQSRELNQVFTKQKVPLASHRSSKDVRLSADLLFQKSPKIDRLKKPCESPRKTFERQRSETLIAQSPIFVNIFAPQMPSARIYFSSGRDKDLLEKPAKMKSNNDPSKRLGLLQQMFKESSLHKLGGIKSTLIERFTQKTGSNSKEPTVKAQKEAVHRRISSQAHLKTTGSHKRLPSYEKALPPETLLLEEPPRFARTESVRAKLQKVFGASNGFKQKPERIEKFQLKYSAASLAEVGARAKFLEKLAKK